MKKVTSILATASVFLATAPSVFAASIGNLCNPGATGFDRLCIGTNSQDIGKVLGSIINLLFLIAGIIALFLLVQGGIKWITSEGETKNVEAARNQIIAAAVGLGVTFLSYLIINLLLQFFLGTGLNNLNLPQFAQ